MNYSHEVERMCTLTKGPKHGPAPIPEEGRWVKAYEVADISVFLTVSAGVHRSRAPAS